MSKRKTTEEFIAEAKQLYEDKYEYDKVCYINNTTEVEIYCNTCEKYFKKKPAAFLNSKQGCPKCGKKERNKKNTSTTEEFIEKARKVHGNKYDYSLVYYKNCRTKVTIKCDCGNIFEQKPNNHLSGCGCSVCGDESRKKKCANHPNKKTQEEFIEEAKLIHGDKYDYSQTKYVNDKTKVKIICKNCGNIFEQKPSNHLGGQGCSECNGGIRKTQEQFINELKEIYKEEFDYSLTVYVNDKTKVKLICKKCDNVFEAAPSKLLQKHSCPYCRQSIGEREIKNYLSGKGIKFCINKTFDDLKDKKLLSYDFYLPDYNLLIEYNGIQHYTWIPKFQPTLHDFHKQKHHDWLKRKYALKNEIKLLTISYKENVLKILDKVLSI